MQFGHRKEFLKLTFGAIALRQSEIQNSKDTFGVFKFFQCHVVRVSSIACYLTPLGKPASRLLWVQKVDLLIQEEFVFVCEKKNVVKF